MKTNLLSTAALLIWTGISFGQAEVSTSPPYEGFELSVNDRTEHYWAYGSGAKDGLGFYHDFNGWKFVSYDAATHGKVTDMDGDYGHVNIITDKDKLVLWSSGHWVPLKGITAIKDLAMSPFGFYVIGTVASSDGTSKTGIFKAANVAPQKPSEWTPVLTTGQGAVAKRLDIDGAGTIYMITGGGQLFSLAQNATEPAIFTGTTTGQTVVAKDVFVTEKNGLYIQDPYGTVHKHNTATNNYASASFSGGSFGVSESGKNIRNCSQQN